MIGVSTDALAKFCQKTTLYSCNAERFRQIVDAVEARCVHPSKIAKKTIRIIGKKTPRFSYAINKNPLLRIFDFFPKKVQFWTIKQILKK